MPNSPRLRRIIARIRPTFATRLTLTIAAFYAGETPEEAATRFRVPVGKVLDAIRKDLGGKP